MFYKECFRKIKTRIFLDQRKRSIIIFAFFFSWILAFPFEGQILYGLADYYKLDIQQMVYGSILAHLLGLFSCNFLIKSLKKAKRFIQMAVFLCMIGSLVFFFTPSFYWIITLYLISYLAGMAVAAWGYYFKYYTPVNERFKTAADCLIFSNVLMILINLAAIHLAPHKGLILAILFLGVALFFTFDLLDKEQLEKLTKLKDDINHQKKKFSNIHKPLVFLSLFVVVITINSGLMYQVVNPAFEHLKWLVSWYWAIPYIVALLIMRNLPRRTNRTYILYVAIAMIGLSFIAFMTLDRSAASYFVVNTLMLGACGIYDLFWWSILGEMLEIDKNPAKILGVGLSANVLGVLLGGVVGNVISTTATSRENPVIIALVVVFITLMILPLLHKYLTKKLTTHVFLTGLGETAAIEVEDKEEKHATFSMLTERENQIAVLLLKGMTYKAIATELHISENTIKTHVKNIYAKFNVKSKIELVNLLASSLYK